MVILYHLSGAENKLWPASNYRFFSGFTWGQGGVDVFFVISGFIITWINYDSLGNPKAIPGHLAKRLLRIYPLYWLVLFLVLASIQLRIGMHGSVEFVSFAGHVKAVFLWPQKFNNLALVPVAWTLVFEVMFYLLFCILLASPARYFIRLLLGWASLCLGIAVYAGETRGWTFFSLLNVEFILGCLAAVALRAKVLIPPATAVGGGVAGFILAAGIEAQGLANFDYYWTRLCCFGPPSVLVLYGLVALEFQNRLIMPAFLQRLGDSSYAIYLIHLSCYAAVRRFTHGTEITFGPEFGPWQQFGWCMLMLTAALAGGFALHHLAERPIGRLVRCLLDHRRGTVTIRPVQ